MIETVVIYTCLIIVAVIFLLLASVGLIQELCSRILESLDYKDDE